MATRPVVTYALFAFNQEKYVRDAVLGALAQTYEPLEIIVSDDCSTDGTFERIEEVLRSYSGPHRILVNRNARNLGLIGHVNKLVEMSSGDLIVVGAGDDISRPDRVASLVDAYERSQVKPMLMHSNAIAIDDRGNELGLLTPPVGTQPASLAQLAESHSIYIGATGCWHRDLFKQCGTIHYTDAYEDLVLGFRAALMDAVLHVSEPLVKYRVDVGISADPLRRPLPRRAVLAKRKRNNKVMLDVYCQRLQDLGRMADPVNTRLLQARLENRVVVQRRQLLFYDQPLALAGTLVTGKPFLTVKAVLAEARHWFDFLAMKLRRTGSRMSAFRPGSEASGQP